MSPTYPSSLPLSFPPETIKTFVEAREHKPKETMKKVNWAPVPKNEASLPGRLWNVTLCEEATDAPTLEEVDGPIGINPAMVEKLFSFPKQTVKEKKKPEEEKVLANSFTKTSVLLSDKMNDS